MLPQDSTESAFIMYIVSVSLVMLVANFFFVFLSILLGIQTLNFANAQTTQARFKSQNATEINDEYGGPGTIQQANQSQHDAAP